MDDIQSKMNAILSNPQMMQQLMNIAQSFQQSQCDHQENPPEQNQAATEDIDIATIQRLAGLAGKSNIDSHQRTLLNALSPYLSGNRIAKLEKAMRAAKMANLASAFLNGGGFHFNPGR